MPVMQTNIGLHLFTGLLLIAGYVVATLVRVGQAAAHSSHSQL